MLDVSDAPGLGVEVDEEAATRYLYTPKYLSVARLSEAACTTGEGSNDELRPIA